MTDSAPITPGRALSRRAARAGGWDQIPHQVAAALEGLGLLYLEPTWTRAARKLWKLQSDPGVKRTGGVAPRDFKHRLRTDCHPKTVERHLRILEAVGFLERNDVMVPGRHTRFPRRGPGSRVRYWIPGASSQLPSPRPRSRPRRQEGPPAPPDRAQEPERGPPEPLPEGDAAVRSGHDYLTTRGHLS